MEPDTYVIICGSLACWPIQTLRPFCAEQCLEHLGNCCRAPPRGSACEWSEITENSKHSLWLAMRFFLSSHRPTATKQHWQSKLGSAQAWHSSAAASLRDIYKSWEAASRFPDEEGTFPHFLLWALWTRTHVLLFKCNMMVLSGKLCTSSNNKGFMISLGKQVDLTAKETTHLNWQTEFQGFGLPKADLGNLGWRGQSSLQRKWIVAGWFIVCIRVLLKLLTKKKKR